MDQKSIRKLDINKKDENFGRFWKSMFFLLLTGVLFLPGCLTPTLPKTVVWENERYFASGRVYPNNNFDLKKVGNVEGFPLYRNTMIFEEALFLKTSDGFIEYEWEYKPQLMRKPNIYLYPKKEREVKISLKFKGTITDSDPPYEKGWTVSAKPDGTLINSADGKEYPFLFWEGEYDSKWELEGGWLVSGVETEAFLADALDFFGLTEREKSDFLAYWVPKMKNNQYNLISFINEDYSKAVKLKVSPQPDTVIRIFMLYKGLDKPVRILPQKLEPFQREGFTVVEWGGGEWVE